MTWRLGPKNAGNPAYSWSQKQRCRRAFAQVAGYVQASYPNTNATQRFLDRADPWVIAHAIVEGSAVVTMEIAVQPNVQKVKIPNGCSHFNVPCVNTYQMLRELGVRWNN